MATDYSRLAGTAELIVFASTFEEATFADGSVAIAFSSQGQRLMVVHVPVGDACRLVEMLTDLLRQAWT